MGNIHIEVKMIVSFWFFMPHSELCLLQLSEEGWKETSEKNKAQKVTTTATTYRDFCNFCFRKHFLNKLHSSVVSLTFLMTLSKAKLKITMAPAATKLLQIFAIFIHIFTWHTVLTSFCKQQAGYYEHTYSVYTHQ